MFSELEHVALSPEELEVLRSALRPHRGAPRHTDPAVREAIERIREGMRLIGTRLGHRNAPTHRKES